MSVHRDGQVGLTVEHNPVTGQDRHVIAGLIVHNHAVSCVTAIINMLVESR
jgi:hypothetical protein